MRIGIIGLGVVGSAQARLFAEHDLVTYDPKEGKLYPKAELAECEFVVVAVGTPPAADGSADLQYVEAAIAALPSYVPVLLRSTVPPGTTDRLLGDRLACFVPEFMGENPAHPWQESSSVPFLILGGSALSRAYFYPLLRPFFPRIHECAAKEAEVAKYMGNLYWATRVTYVNEMAKVCESFDIDYEAARVAWLQDPRIGGAYTYREGHPPGFGGACWPKDLAALIAASPYQAEFLKAVQDANARFRA
jgi:UDPglucose 6-dehydrogenase